MKTFSSRFKGFAAGFLAFWILEGLFALFLFQEAVFSKRAVFLAVHFCAAGAFALVFWRRIRKPFRKTEQAMEDFGQGYIDQSELKKQMPVSKGYTEMLRQFDSVIDRKELLKLAVEQSRLIALQNQMNPHFLYNTLDAIRGDVLRAGMTELAGTMEALSMFLSYSISELDKYAAVGEEICNVNDFYITRMTLQPLVENAISHGLERKASMGTVTVKVIQTEKKIFLLVSDDGVGMSQEETDRLNAMLHRPGTLVAGQKGKGGIALSNVNTRIKLLFGDEYGLTVFAQQGIGCTVQVKCPILTRKTVYEKRTSEY